MASKQTRLTLGFADDIANTGEGKDNLNETINKY
jgi:hypothetical protein